MKNRGRHCAICGKGSMERHLVSHSKRNTVRHAFPNLRRIRTKIGRSVRAILVCSKCLKRGKVVPALSRRISTLVAPAR